MKDKSYVAGIVNFPKEYVLPCYLAVGYPTEDAMPVQQITIDVKQKIHYNEW